MSSKKLVFAKKSGAEKRIEKFESNIQYAPVTDKAFDGERSSVALQDEVGLWSTPSQKDIEAHLRFVEESKRAVTFTVKE